MYKARGPATTGKDFTLILRRIAKAHAAIWRSTLDRKIAEAYLPRTINIPQLPGTRREDLLMSDSRTSRKCWITAAKPLHSMDDDTAAIEFSCLVKELQEHQANDIASSSLLQSAAKILGAFCGCCAVPRKSSLDGFPRMRFPHTLLELRVYTCLNDQPEPISKLASTNMTK